MYVHFLKTPLSSKLRNCQAVSVLQTIHPGDYHVTIVSPDTFTTFTPLLPCKSVAISDVSTLKDSLLQPQLLVLSLSVPSSNHSERS